MIDEASKVPGWIGLDISQMNCEQGQQIERTGNKNIGHGILKIVIDDR